MMSISHIGRAGALVAILAVLASCTEPRADQGKPTPIARLDARVELSDSLAGPGREVLATVRLAGPAMSSATVRLAYDTTGLQFVSEESLTDGVTRAMNAMPGVIRLAAISPKTFVDGRVYVVRFNVRRASALSSLRVTVDEVHTAEHADAMPLLTRTP